MPELAIEINAEIDEGREAKAAFSVVCSKEEVLCVGFESLSPLLCSEALEAGPVPGLLSPGWAAISGAALCSGRSVV
jgi:hypothetical protein